MQQKDALHMKQNYHIFSKLEKEDRNGIRQFLDTGRYDIKQNHM